MTEGVATAALGEEAPLGSFDAFGYGDDAVAVSLDRFCDPREKGSLVEHALGEQDDVRRVALRLAGEARGGGDTARVAAHPHQYKDLGRGLGQRGDEVGSVGAIVLIEPLGFGAVCVVAFLFVARRAEGTAWRVAQRTYRGGRFLARVDQFFAQRTQDTVAACVDLADLIAVASRGLDH